jgi:hypothetical protein
LVQFVAKLAKQRHQLVVTAVDVADDVKRAMLRLPVIPERLPLDRNGLDFFRAGKRKNMAKAFALQSTPGPVQLLRLLPYYVGAEIPVNTAPVPVLAEPLVIKDSMAIIPDRPGHGMQWDEASVRKYAIE